MLATSHGHTEHKATSAKRTGVRDKVLPGLVVTSAEFAASLRSKTLQQLLDEDEVLMDIFWRYETELSKSKEAFVALKQIQAHIRARLEELQPTATIVARFAATIANMERAERS